jgi:hypothetical protein
MEILRLIADAALTIFLIGGLWTFIDTPRRLAVHWHDGERGHGTVLAAMGITLAVILCAVAVSRALTGAPRWLGYIGL